MSFDAYLGGTRLYAEEAYRFARGEEIEQNGRQVKSDAPLDFLGVSDHSEYLGQLRLAADPNGPLAQTAFGKLFASTPAEQRIGLIYKLADSFGSGGNEPPCCIRPRRCRRTAADRRCGEVLPARQVHHLRGLRVVLDSKRRQSASQRDLPRTEVSGVALLLARLGQSRETVALHRASALERYPGAGHSTQFERERRIDVVLCRFGSQSNRSRVC